MNEDFKGIGTRIIERMKVLGLKQVDIIRETGISKTAISNYVNGNRIPDTLSIYKLSQALETSIEWILTGKEFEPKKNNPPTSVTQQNIAIDIEDTIGDRIKARMKQLDIRYVDLCKLTGIPRQAINSYVEGKAFPNMSAVLKLSLALETSMEWLLTGSFDFNNDSSNISDSLILSPDEKDIIDKVRSGLKPIFDNEIKRLTGEAGRLNDEELDLILKLRELDQREQEDIYDHINWKYEKSLRKKVSSPSMNGEEKELKAESETA